MIRNLENLAKVATVCGMLAFAGCKDSREEEKPGIQNSGGNSIADSYDEGAYMRAKTRRSLERAKRINLCSVGESYESPVKNKSENSVAQNSKPIYKIKMDQKIIPGGHFTWGEATHNGRCIPGEKEVTQIIETAKYMEKVREKFADRAIHVNSWFRDEDYNKKNGGADDSQHPKGKAVDFTVEGISPSETYKTLEPFVKGGLGKYAGFIHVDTREQKARWDKTQINYAGLNSARTTARN